jgi:quercetin 2,3-dioxygenase
MKYALHKSHSRGETNIGWLDSKHSFSFGSFYDSSKNGFGALKVLNDDHVSAGQGFGMHSHKNMEIISIPLFGIMEHKDSMGNISTITPEKIQVMSAGSGIQHSEYNKSNTDDLHFLQIWITPNQLNVEPRYDEFLIEKDKLHNQWLQILSPNPKDSGVWIYQNSWFFLSTLEKNKTLDYELKDLRNGLYLFILEGSIIANGIEITHRDGLGIWEIDKLILSSKEDSKVLLMEVPLKQ